MINTRIVDTEYNQFTSFEIDINGVLTFVVTTNVNHYSYYLVVSNGWIDCGAGEFWKMVSESVEYEDFAKIVNHLHDFIKRYGVQK